MILLLLLLMLLQMDPTLPHIPVLPQAHTDRDHALVQIPRLLQIDTLGQMLDIFRRLLRRLLVADLLVDALDHGFSEGQAGALPLTDQLPVLGGVEQIESLFVVVESGLTSGHVPEDVMHDGDTLKSVLVVDGGLSLQIPVLLQGLLEPVLLHPLQGNVVLSFEPLLRELLLQFLHGMALLQLLLNQLSLLIIALLDVQFQQMDQGHSPVLLISYRLVLLLSLPVILSHPVGIASQDHVL